MNENLKTIILNFFKKHDLETNDLHFYSAEEWKNRGEIYGKGAELNVTFDGNILYHIVNHTNGKWSFKMDDLFTKELEKAGVYYELGYTWCLGLYKI